MSDPVVPGAPGAPGAAAEPPENQEMILAKSLINCLFVLLRTAYVHDQNNASLLPPLRNIENNVQALHAQLAETRFVLRVVGQTFFVNAMLVKLDQGSFQNAEFLQVICEELAIGEFEFHAGCAEPDFRALMRTIVEAVRSDEEGAKNMPRKLGLINLNLPVQAGTGKGRALLDRRQYVLRTYAMSLMFCNNLMDQWKKGKTPRLSEVKKLSQSLLDLVSEQGATLLGLTQLKAYRKFVANHFVNVAIIAQVIGETAGLNKEEKVQLGMTGLLHEIGAMDLPQQVIDRMDTLGQAEVDILAKLPFMSIARLLELKSLGEQGLARVAALYENAGHTAKINAYRGKRQPEMMAQIIAVADAYDHLSTSRMGNQARRPDQVMEVLLLNRERRYAAWAVKALAEGIGRFPIGTMVELSTGERGIVVDRPRGAAPADRPRVRLISSADGRPLEAGAVVDLAEPDSAGQLSRSIRRTLDAEKEKVNVPHFFLD